MHVASSCVRSSRRRALAQRSAVHNIDMIAVKQLHTSSTSSCLSSHEWLNLQLLLFRELSRKVLHSFIQLFRLFLGGEFMVL